MQEVWRQAGEAKHLSQLLKVRLHAAHISTATTTLVESQLCEPFGWTT